MTSSPTTSARLGEAGPLEVLPDRGDGEPVAIDEDGALGAPRERLDPRWRRSPRTGRGPAPPRPPPRGWRTAPRAPGRTPDARPAGPLARRTPWRTPPRSSPASARPSVALRSGRASRSTARSGPELEDSSGCPDRSGSASMRERARPGPADELEVVGEPREPQVGHARLPHVEQRPLAAQPEVLVGELEPVGRSSHRVEPGPRLVVVSSEPSNRMHVDGWVRPPDPPAELMELREPEPLRVLDEHHGRVRHVDARPRSPWSRSAGGAGPSGTPPSRVPSRPGASGRGGARRTGPGRPSSRAARPRPPRRGPGSGCPRRSRRTPRTPGGRPPPPRGRAR